jgi:quercetin dioxygenase-like cupin family protein
VSGAKPVVVGPEGSEAIWFGGGLVTFLVTAEQSGSEYAVIHDVMPRGKTTPLHYHPSFDETVYVIEGELLVHIDGVEHVAGRGAIASIPRGTPHALLVTSEEARIIGFVTPGDVFERFFREGGEAVTDRDAAAPPLDIEKVKAAGERTGGMVVLGAPPFAAVGAHT